jgi:hypothetical protein
MPKKLNTKQGLASKMEHNLTVQDTTPNSYNSNLFMWLCTVRSTII